ncbi:hypothetical protein ACEWY4_007500 [Coilia grayii]|uniref:P2X purinoreceptor 7 intracellular domain-containing protein n=1 Tax=Coilia grayii TaxID=363190 RepID=A0ABD1KGL7_9TELE
MSGEEERSFQVTRNPVAYAFEPIRRERKVQIKKVGDLDEPLLLLSGVERVGNTAWCSCGHCTAMPTPWESVCCQEAHLGHLLGELRCITQSRTYEMLCCERDVLEVAMLSLREVRAETLDRPINSSLFRLTAYRQFTLWARGHLGRRNRRPIPACVVTTIRTRFPSLHYHGFEYNF